MQTTITTTTDSANVTNFDAFKDLPEIRKGLQLTELAKLQQTDENQSLSNIERQINIGRIITEGRDFLKTQGAALKAHGINGKLDENLCALYGYKRAYLFMLMAAAKNADKFESFKAWVISEREQGARLSVNLPLFAQFCKGSTDSGKNDMQGIRIEYNGKRFTQTAKVQRCELNAVQIVELVNELARELKLQDFKAFTELVESFADKAKLNTKRTESKANESAKKASAKVKAQPAAIA